MCLIDWFMCVWGGGGDDDDGVYITGDRLLARKIIIRLIHFFTPSGEFRRRHSLGLFARKRMRNDEKIIKLSPFMGRKNITLLVANIIYIFGYITPYEKRFFSIDGNRKHTHIFILAYIILHNIQIIIFLRERL